MDIQTGGWLTTLESGGQSILEFPKAREWGLNVDIALGRVWIASGITQFGQQVTVGGGGV